MRVRTLQRILGKEGITKWIAQKRPLVLEIHARQGFAFSTEYKDYDEINLEKFVFSDESSVERGAGVGHVWVFRTPQQKWKKDMIHP